LSYAFLFPSNSNYYWEGISLIFNESKCIEKLWKVVLGGELKFGLKMFLLIEFGEFV